MKKILNTIDLFAGCGGLMDGFQQEGHYNTLACVEWELYPCKTLVNRLEKKWGHEQASSEVVRFDIQRTDDLFYGYNDPRYGSHPGVDKIIGRKKVDVIIGGPPCQAYSLAGRIRDEHGMKDDYRNYLFESYVKVVEHYRPYLFVFENVIGMLSAAPGGVPILDKIRKAFDDAGYELIDDFRKALYDVSDFGVPQHRKRVIIMGVRKDAVKNEDVSSIIRFFYEFEMPRRKQPQRTVNDAIGDLPKIYPSKEIYSQEGHKYSHTPAKCDSVLNHSPRFHSQRDIKIFRMLSEDILSGRNQFTSIESLKSLYTTVTGKHSNIHKFYVLRSNEPSNTIPAHLYKDGLRHIHPDPEQARSITVREAARLQSFQDDFEFIGPMMEQYKMIGNAVPSDFAKAIAKSLYNTYSKFASNFK